VDDIKAWDLKNIIIHLLNKKQTNHIYNCATPHEIWTKLESIHSDGRNLNKQPALTRFFTYRISASQPIFDVYTEIDELARSLNEMGIKMEEATVVTTKNVPSLPEDKFHAFEKAWDSVVGVS
jgi:hypothetical protein